MRWIILESVLMKKIYIYGISGVYNYGCEAMIRGISSELKEVIPNTEIIYKSFSFEEDSRALSDCTTIRIEELKRIVNPMHKKAIRFLRRTFNIARPEDRLGIETDWIRECDALIIIGGDIFDLTPNQRSAPEYHNERIYVSQIVKRNHGKVILWGISVGNFDCNPNAKSTLLRYFKETVDFAIIRDEKSYAYLKSNGISNIALCSDPAFIQRTVQIENNLKNILGINLSPLANRYLNLRKTDEEWIEIWADIITKIFNTSQFDELYLIPHVVNQLKKNDDDYWYLAEISHRLEKNNIPTFLVPGGLGFLGVKKYIMKCKLIFAARMHCAINSITCGVPTIFFAYSQKSFGMCKHVYGTEKYVLDMNKLIDHYNDEIVCRFINEIDDIKKYLSHRNKDLYNSAKSAINYVVNIIGDNNE